MALHSFDPEVAKEVGVNAAVIYQNIHYWCEHNAANERNFHEGRYWTYNSNKAFTELFPYMSAKQIRRALDKLIEAGYIAKGCFNKSKFDQTCWYSDLHLPSGANPSSHLPSGANAVDQEGEPIPVINTKGKPSSVRNDNMKSEYALTSERTVTNNSAREKSKPADRFRELVEEGRSHVLENCTEEQFDRLMEAVVPMFARTRKRQDMPSQKALCRKTVDELYGYAKEHHQDYAGDIVYDTLAAGARGRSIEDRYLSYWLSDGFEGFKADMRVQAEYGDGMGWSKW